jgi:dCMP deaminase
LRPSLEMYFLQIAGVVATRATCARRAVGCVLVDKDRRILSTGYNGVARGMPHCTDKPCPGALLPSGTGLDACEAIHAEINALLQCRDINAVHTAYLTCTPCVSCVKALMASGCQHIVASSAYAASHDHARELWEATAGRTWWVVEVLPPICDAKGCTNEHVGEPVPGYRKTVAAFSPGSPRSRGK